MILICLLGLILGVIGPASGDEKEPSLHVALRYSSAFGEKGRGVGELLSPSDLVFDATRRAYVADTGNDRIVRFDDDGLYLSEVGGFGWEEGQFSRPTGIAMIGLELFVSDSENQRFVVMTPRLRVVASVGGRDVDGAVRLGRPGGIAGSREGELYLTDQDLDQVVQVSTFSRTDRSFGGYGYGAGELRTPTAVDVSDDDRVAVCDTGNDRVVLFDRFGNFVRALGEEVLDAPEGVVFGPKEILFVSDTGNHRIVVFDLKSGAAVGRSGGPRSGDGTDGFDTPRGLAMLDDESLAIVDSANHRVVIYKVMVLRK